MHYEVTTADFPPIYSVPVESTVPATMADLMLAAITVGVTPLTVNIGASGFFGPRDLNNIIWRAFMVAGLLEQKPNGWQKSDAYSRLDPTEKGAASYFLGNIQAATSLYRLVKIDFLAHLDLVLRHQNRPIPTGQRPDFLGLSLSSNTKLCVAVESKGRSTLQLGNVVDKAKEQALQMPAIIGYPMALHVASVAYFDAGDMWKGHLQDPPAGRTTSNILRPEWLVYEHYKSMFSLMDSTASDGMFIEGERVVVNAELDVQLSMPESIYKFFSDSITFEKDSLLWQEGQAEEFLVLANNVAGASEVSAPAMSGFIASNNKPGSDRSGQQLILGSSWSTVAETSSPETTIIGVQGVQG